MADKGPTVEVHFADLDSDRGICGMAHEMPSDMIPLGATLKVINHLREHNGQTSAMLAAVMLALLGDGGEHQLKPETLQHVFDDDVHIQVSGSREEGLTLKVMSGTFREMMKAPPAGNA